MTEIEVEETHFEKGTTEVLHRGRVTFWCKADESFCQPSRVTSEFGDRLYSCADAIQPNLRTQHSSGERPISPVLVDTGLDQ